MKIILFGSNGMLGTYVKKFFEDKYTLLNLTRSDLDLGSASESQITSFMNGVANKGDIIINAAGIIKQREYDILEMINVNSVFPNILGKIKKTIGIEVIHITTDCVFNGEIGNYNESSYHDCIDDYGKSKSLGENANLTTIRTSIIGEELSNKKSLIEWVKSNKNKEIFGYKNHLWNGVTCLELCKLIHDMIKTNDFWIGVKHIHSPDTLSKFELVNIINEVYKLNIIVKETETEKKCYRNLSSFHENRITKKLKDQIIETSKFIIN